MKIICLTFTCARDAERAAFHQKFLPANWRKIWCVESKDADLPVPAETEKLVRDFPRGGSLRQVEAIRGMRAVFLELANECDLLVKLDSDTALFRPEAFTVPAEVADTDFTYIRRHTAESRLLANGCCYAVSERALRRLKNFDEARDIPPAFGGHEDLIFSAFWTGGIVPENRDLTLCQIDKKKVWWSIKTYAGNDIFAGHFGYIPQAQDFALCEALHGRRDTPVASA